MIYTLEEFTAYFFFASDSSQADSIANRIWTLDQEASVDWMLQPLKERRI